MQLPFDSVSFFNVFGSYNLAIWPLQIITYLLALTLLYFFFKRSQYLERTVFYVLSFFWLVNGVGYHIAYFSDINKAAIAFGALFIIQALVFAWRAFKTPLADTEITPLRRATSLILIVYAMLFYSLIGYFAGHQYPNVPIFGVAPCPTAIFTFGVLLWVGEHLRWHLYLIPVLWSVIGTSAAFVLGVREDFGLAAAAIVLLVFQFSRRFQN